MSNKEIEELRNELEALKIKNSVYENILKELSVNVHVQSNSNNFELENRNFTHNEASQNSIQIKNGTFVIDNDLFNYSTETYHEEKFRSLFESSPDIVALIDTNGTILNINKVAKGYKKKEVIGSNVKDFLSIDEKKEFDKAVKKVQKTKKVQSYESKSITPEGSIANWYNRVSAIREADGVVNRLVINFTDVTKGKEAEESLREALLRLELSMSASNSGFWSLNVETGDVLWDQNIPQLLGIPEHEIEERKIIWFNSIHEEDRSRVINGITEACKIEGSHYDEEFRIVRDDGSFQYLSNMGVSVTNPNGERLIYGLTHDITKLKESENRIRESEAEKLTILNGISANITYIDRDYKVVWVNKAASSYLKKPVNKLLQKQCYAIWNCSSETCGNCPAKTVFSTGKSSSIKSVKDGGTVWHESCEPVYNSGKVVGVICIANDITEETNLRRKLIVSKQELQSLNATKDKFFSIIAHDLINPFTSLLGYSTLLKHHYKDYDEERLENFLENLHKNLVNTYKLVENLLTWSRTQTDGIKYTAHKINLSRIVKETVESVQVSLEAKKIVLQVEMSEEIETMADINILQTVLRNLVSNAIKFTNIGGEIVLDVKLVNDRTKIVFSVSDNGKGMSDKQLKNLFHIDKSSSTKGTNNETGTGLGLILCKNLIEKHKGTLFVNSKIDKGSTFGFSIPYNKTAT